MKNYSFLKCLFIIMLLLALLSVATELSTAVAALPVGTAYTQSPFTPGDTNSVHATEDLADSTTYLPLVERSPIIPNPPVLNPISNTDGDGNYTVSWSSSEGATTYTLEEDDNVGFSSPTTVYSGSSTSKNISGRDVGTYYYRVRASNAYASSDWSNVVCGSNRATTRLPTGREVAGNNQPRKKGVFHRSRFTSMPDCVGFFDFRLVGRGRMW